MHSKNALTLTIHVGLGHFFTQLPAKLRIQYPMHYKMYKNPGCSPAVVTVHGGKGRRFPFRRREVTVSLLLRCFATS